MKLIIDNEFKQICADIMKENKTEAEWSEIQSGDMFQSKNYCGGYEDGVFAFGYFGAPLNQDIEYWFEIPLKDLPKVLKGEITEVQLNERLLKHTGR